MKKYQRQYKCTGLRRNNIMNQESTLGIIKPDAVDRNLIGSIIKMIEENNITEPKLTK